jgi:hypothetical protein
MCGSAALRKGVVGAALVAALGQPQGLPLQGPAKTRFFHPFFHPGKELGLVGCRLFLSGFYER